VRVLLATDGGSAAHSAGTLLARIGARSGVEVTVLAVASFDLALEAAEELGRYSAETARTRVDEIARAAAERLANEGLKARSAVSEGHPAAEILQAVEDEGYELTVVGAGRESWLGQLMLGSVGTAVLQASPSAVLIVHDLREDAEEVRVLLGTDGSEGADRAVRTLLELADPARCSVVVMSVAASTSAEAPAEAATHGERAASLLREAGFTAELRISSGHPGRLLLEEATRGDHDLVVVGSRGTSRVRRAVLGSVSDQLVRRSRATLVGR